MLGMWTDRTHEHELPERGLLQLWWQRSQILRLPGEGCRKKAELRGLKAVERAPQVHAVYVEETTGEVSTQKEEPAKVEKQEEERLVTPKEDTPRAKVRDSTTWQSQALKRIPGQDHQG